MYIIILIIVAQKCFKKYQTKALHFFKFNVIIFLVRKIKEENIWKQKKI